MMKQNSVSILVGADIVPTKSNMDMFISGNSAELLGDELINEINRSDFFVLNLETPLIDSDNPISKSGPCLRANVNSLNAIKKMNVRLLGICNNHIKDHGEEGIESTIEAIKSYEIDYIGAGKGIEEAKQTRIETINGIRIGFYACAEHEFSIVDGDGYGANPFDPYISYKDVENLKQRVDYVIVLYHGGREDYPYPTPELQKTCRFFVDAGADVVLVQHTHCIGAEESYLGKKIVYGQGNFLFDAYQREGRDKGILVNILLNREEKHIEVSLSYIPIKKVDNTIRMAKGKERDKILSDFFYRSSQILDEDFVNDRYRRLIEEQKNQIKMLFGGRIVKNRFFVFLNKISGGKLMDIVFPKSNRLAIYDMISCESNVELVRSIFKK